MRFRKRRKWSESGCSSRWIDVHGLYTSALDELAEAREYLSCVSDLSSFQHTHLSRRWKLSEITPEMNAHHDVSRTSPSSDSTPTLNQQTVRTSQKHDPPRTISTLQHKPNMNKDEVTRRLSAPSGFTTSFSQDTFWLDENNCPGCGLPKDPCLCDDNGFEVFDSPTPTEPVIPRISNDAFQTRWVKAFHNYLSTFPRSRKEMLNVCLWLSKAIDMAVACRRDASR